MTHQSLGGLHQKGQKKKAQTNVDPSTVATPCEWAISQNNSSDSSFCLKLPEFLVASIQQNAGNNPREILAHSNIITQLVQICWISYFNASQRSFIKLGSGDCEAIWVHKLLFTFTKPDSGCLRFVTWHIVSVETAIRRLQLHCGYKEKGVLISETLVGCGI